MGLHQLAGNGKPQPAASGHTTARGIAPVEAVKDVEQVGRIDAGAAILHRKENPLLLSRDLHFNATPGWCVAQGVREQIGQDLTNALGVPQERWQVRGNVQSQLNSGLLGAGQQTRHNALGQFPPIDFGQIQRKVSGFGLGQGTQVLHQAAQQQRLLVDRVQPFGCQREDAILQGFHCALDGGQRRAQFVGHVGHQIAP